MRKVEREQKRLEATAYREAGHAVMAHTLGVPMHGASIVPKGGSLGHVRFKKPGRLILEEMSGEVTPRAQDGIERNIQVAYAGRLTEKMYSGRDNRAGGWSDYGEMADLALCACSSPGEARAFLKWLELRAAAHLGTRRFKVAVEAVARELLARKTLTGREINKTIIDGIQDAAGAAYGDYGGNMLSWE